MTSTEFLDLALVAFTVSTFALFLTDAISVHVMISRKVRMLTRFSYRATNATAVAARRIASRLEYSAALATRWGLGFTVLGLILGFTTADGGRISLEALGVALVTTFLGIALASAYEFSARRLVKAVPAPSGATGGDARSHDTTGHDTTGHDTTGADNNQRRDRRPEGQVDRSDDGAMQRRFEHYWDQQHGEQREDD